MDISYSTILLLDYCSLHTSSAMPRSATDATRFTATGPYAQSYANVSTTPPSAFSSSASPPTRGTNIPLPQSPPPPNETPQEKVARLREAARQAKLAQEPAFERVLVRGRWIADKMHKATVVGLISLSIVCTGMATYSFVDMMRYNRRKSREFFQEQQRNYDIALRRALEAEKDGTLTADLGLVLNKERAVLAYEEEQARKGSLIKQAKEWLFGGLAMQEHPGGRLGKGGFDAEEIKRIAEGAFTEEGANKLRDPDARELEPQVMVKEAAAVRDQAQNSRRSGGTLDEMADGIANDVQEKGKSWWRWVTGR